jgi:hypothetical protein
MTEQKLEEHPEKKARRVASEAYHDHSSNPSSCLVYKEHAEKMGRQSTRCPCEDSWSKFLEYVAGYVISFGDGGDPEGGVLHRGTKVECEEIKANVHAISYSGGRSVEEASFFIVEAVVYDTFQEGGGTA